MSGIGSLMRIGGEVAADELLAMAAAAPERGAPRFLRRSRGAVLAALGRAGAAAGLDLEVRLDGRLHNRAELSATLADELATAAGDPDEPTDPELIAAAYRRWGAACPERLVGEFAFILWDGARRRLLAARDALGVKPLHWSHRAGAVAVASEARQVLAAPGVSSAPDVAAAIRHLAIDLGSPQSTAFRDVRRLPAGHRLRADARGARVERYWRPDPKARTEYPRHEDYVERFRELFERAVADRMPASGASGILVSGGTDSSSVAAQARALLRSRRQGEAAIRGVSFAFPHLPACDESEFARTLEGPGLKIDFLDAGRLPYLSPGLRPRLETPFLGWESAIDAAFARLGERGASVVFTGYGGDGLLMGTARVYAEALRRGDLTVLGEMARHARRHERSLAGLVWTLGVKPMLPAVVRTAWRSLRGSTESPIPPWIRPRLVRESGIRGRGEEGRGLGVRTARERNRLAATEDGHLGNCVYWLDRRAAEHGLDVRHPFLDRRLVEYVVSIPPRLLFQAGRRRVVLVDAMEGLLPEPIRQRTRKGPLSLFFHHSLRRSSGAAILRGAFRESLAATLGWVDGVRLRSSCEEYLGGQDRWGPHLWAALSLELWLRHHGERLGIDPGSGCERRRRGFPTVATGRRGA